MTHGTLTGDKSQTPCLLYPASLCRDLTLEAQGRATGQQGRDGAGWPLLEARWPGCVLGAVGRAVLRQSSLKGGRIIKGLGQTWGSEHVLCWETHRGQSRASPLPSSPDILVSPPLSLPPPAPPLSCLLDSPQVSHS